MKTLAAVCLCFVSIAIAPRLQAQEDAEGCKDSTLISRMPGSTIESCDTKAFDQATLQMKDEEKIIEGEVHTWQYAKPESVSALQVLRNVKAALVRAGFTVVYEDAPTILTAKKGNIWFGLDSRDAYYDQTIVITKEMAQEISASDLSDQLAKSGRVAIYGIHFDTGKATIQPDSAGVLQEIAKLMQQEPALKLRVEGHTDNVGAAAANQTLSEKRAQAVIAWLGDHSVDKTRLTAAGFGASKPVGDNATDEGRAKNRRVELVKR